MSTALPILYSFRRCPYAIRARMAVFCAGVDIKLQEVSLKNKPTELLRASSKGTVPVLCVGEHVLDESLDIMHWALAINDPVGWLSNYSSEQMHAALRFVEENDLHFKPRLDKYKYATRFPEQSVEYYRDQCGCFLRKLEGELSQQSYLMGSKATFADVAVFPFVRQFSMVEPLWFEHSEYAAVRSWLDGFLSSLLFAQVMEKYSAP